MHPILTHLSLVLVCLLGTALVCAGPAQAAGAKPATSPKTAAGPRRIGTFDDWTAATNQEAGTTVCYAFTRARASTPPVPGRGDVILTVTHRPGSRDAVALTAGFAYATGAAVSGETDQGRLAFYTAHRSAFARDNHAAVAALRRAGELTMTSPGPRDAAVVDRFSLKGFTAAYAAIGKACPA